MAGLKACLLVHAVKLRNNNECNLNDRRAYDRYFINCDNIRRKVAKR